MIRLMISACLVAPVFASGLAAQQDAAANATTFLAGKHEPPKAAFDGMEFPITLLGVKLGSARFKAEKTAFNGEPAVRFTSDWVTKLGELDQRGSGVAYFRPDWQPLWEQTHEFGGGKLSDESTLIRSGDKFVVASRVKRKNTAESTEFPGSERLVSDSASILIACVLPRKPGLSYEFLRWSHSDRALETVVFTVGTEEEAAGKKCQRVDVVTHKNAGADKKPKTEKSIFWVDTDGRIAQAVVQDAMRLTEGDAPGRKPLDRKEMLERKTPENAAYAALLAMNTGDKKLAREAMDGREMLRRDIKKDKDAKDWTEEKIEESVREHGDAYPERLARKPDAHEEHAARTFREVTFHEGILAVYKAKNGATIIWFSESVRKEMPQEIPLAFEVEKDKEGKWRVVQLHLGNIPELEQAAEKGNNGN